MDGVKLSEGKEGPREEIEFKDRDEIRKLKEFKCFSEEQELEADKWVQDVVHEIEFGIFELNKKNKIHDFEIKREKIEKALYLAYIGHHHQIRKSDSSKYVEHIKASVLNYLEYLPMDHGIICGTYGK